MSTPQYTQQTPPYTQPGPAQAPWNALAIASFICGLCGLAIVPVILGHMAVARIKRSGERGQALAVIGMVLGYLTCAVIVIAVIVTIAATIWGLSQ